jgi:hypothetical protein
MSTKIYNSRRCSVRDLNRLIGIIRRAAIKRAAWQIGTIMGKVNHVALKKTVDSYKADWAKSGKTPPSWIEKGLWTEMAMDLCEASSAQAHRDLDGCLDCGINVWVYEGMAYLMLIGEQYLFEKVRFPKWAQDFDYWNNTDAPKGFTQEQWDKRGRIWEKVCGNHNATRLYHEIVNFKPGESGPTRIMMRRIRIPEQYAEDDAFCKRRTRK